MCGCKCMRNDVTSKDYKKEKENDHMKDVDNVRDHIRGVNDIQEHDHGVNVTAVTRSHTRRENEEINFIV